MKPDSIICLAAILTFSSLSFQLSDAEINQSRLIEWVSKNAIHLNTLDSNRIDLETFSFLDPLLQSKRIIFLGEPDHYIHEKYDYRLIFIKYLYRKGWRHIGMEMGRSDGRRVDRFLESGDLIHLNRLGLYGYKGDIRQDRDDYANLSPVLKQQEFWECFLSEEYGFLNELYRLGSPVRNDAQRVHWFGFDIDTWPGGGYTDAAELTVDASDSQIIKGVWEKLSRVMGESREEEIVRLQEALEFVKNERSAIVNALGKSKGFELERTIHCLLDSMQFLVAAWEGRNSEGWIPANTNREKTMFRQVEEVLMELPSDEGIILMGHNMHLSKDHTTVGYHSYYPMWETLGSYLSSKYPQEVLSIWMLYDRGRHATLSGQDQVFEDIQSHPWRIERHLARAGSLYVLPLSSSDPGGDILSKVNYFGVNGRLGRGILLNQINVLFFVDKVKAIRKR